MTEMVIGADGPLAYLPHAALATIVFIIGLRPIVQPPDNNYHSVPLRTFSHYLPGLAIFRFGAGLYCANARWSHEEVMLLACESRPALRWVCLAADIVGDIDYTGSDKLREKPRRDMACILAGDLA